MSYNFIIHCEEIVMMIRITLFQQWLTLHFSHVFLIIWKCRIVECEVWSRGLILSFYIPLAGPKLWSSPAQLQLHSSTLTLTSQRLVTQPRIWFPATLWLTPGPVWYTEHPTSQFYSLINLMNSYWSLPKTLWSNFPVLCLLSFDIYSIPKSCQAEGRQLYWKLICIFYVVCGTKASVSV